MKEYTAPELELIQLEVVDVITISGGIPEPTGPNDMPFVPVI